MGPRAGEEAALGEYEQMNEKLPERESHQNYEAKIMQEKWDDVSEISGEWYPSEGLVRFIARYVQRKTGVDRYEVKRPLKRILDLGCGNGRHVMFFAEQGFEVYGLDCSTAAIQTANKWLLKKGLKAHLQVGDSANLPYEDGFFDIVVACGVLDHMTFSDAKKTLTEMRRVTLCHGYVYVTLRSTEDSEYGRGKKIDHNVFELTAGYEKGIVQHYFDLEEIKELFDALKVFDIELHEEKFPRLYTIDKAFLQSSMGTKRYLDLSQLTDLELKYSRWHIAAERCE